MPYTVTILRRAQRELAQVPPGSTKLAAREGWRIRVGDFRVIYEIDDRQQVVAILHIGHRRDVYR